MVKSIIAVVLAVLLAGVVIAAVQLVNTQIFPLPPGVDFNDREAMSRAVSSMPTGGFVLLLLSYTLGALAGGWLAARMAPRRPLLHAMIVGVLLLAAGVMNFVSIPHPLWVTVLGLLIFLPMSWLGASRARPRAAA